MTVPWIKRTGDEWTATVDRLSLKIRPKGDGRWSWQVFDGERVNPMATGVASSLGAAKTVTEQFVKRSGLV